MDGGIYPARLLAQFEAGVPHDQAFRDLMTTRVNDTRSRRLDPDGD